MTSKLKHCSRCLKNKPFSAFYNDKSRKDGLKPCCKACSDRQQLIAKLNNPDHFTEQKKIAARRRQLRSKHDLTWEDFNKYLSAQSGVCCICGGSNNPTTLPLTPDRDPISKRMRGLLCRSCLRAVHALDADPAKVVVLVTNVTNPDVLIHANYVLKPFLWEAGLS